MAIKPVILGQIGSPNTRGRGTINENFNDLDARIDALVAPEYEFIKVSNIAVISEDAGTPDVIATLVTPELPAGVYEIGYAFQASFSTKDSPVFFKLGGTSPDALFFALAPGTNDADHVNKVYFYPTTFDGGVFTVTLNMYKVDIVDITVNYADLFLRRVG